MLKMPTSWEWQTKTTDKIKTRHTRKHFYHHQWLSWFDPVQIAASASWHLVSYSAAVAPLVQGFQVSCVQGCYSEDLDRSFELLLPSHDLKQIDQFSPEPSHQQSVAVHRASFFFFSCYLVWSSFLYFFVTTLCKPKRRLQENPSWSFVLLG